MKADLHTHTKYSDGVYELSELLAEADKQGVNVIAITDHDTVEACELVDAYASQYRVRVIKGIEITTKYNDEILHLICLFKNNIIPEAILSYCSEQRRMRNTRAKEILTKAKEQYGWLYDENLLFSSTDVVNKAVVFKHLSHMNDIPIDEVKNKLDTGEYSRLQKLSFEQGVMLAKSSECFCILAHPCLIKDKSILKELLKYAIDALEGRYSSRKNDEKYFVDLAMENNILISAGSDFHGDDKHGQLGECTLNANEFKAIEKILFNS